MFGHQTSRDFAFSKELIRLSTVAIGGNRWRWDRWVILKTCGCLLELLLAGEWNGETKSTEERINRVEVRDKELVLYGGFDNFRNFRFRHLFGDYVVKK